MSKMVCRICLRSDIIVVQEIHDALVAFHDELCGINIDENPAYKFCTICEHQLRKFYNFRQKCRRSIKVLDIWKLSNVTDESLENLHEMIPPSSITFKNKNAPPNLMEFTHTDIEPIAVIIKLEKEDSDEKVKTALIEPQTSNLDLQHSQNDLSNYEKNDSVEISFKVEAENVYCEVISNDFDDDDDVNYEPEKKKPKNKTIEIKKKTKLERITRSNLKQNLIEKKLAVKETLNDVTQKITAKRKQFIKNQSKLKDRILKLLKTGEFQDLGENVTMNEEIFLKMFEKCDKSGLRSMLPLKPGSLKELQRLRKFLLYLLKKNNPEYEDIFDVELLDTDAKKLDEFNRRKDRKEYIAAEFKCTRCYRVFEVQRLLEYHNRWHEASTSAHACDICAMRFSSRKALAQHHKTNHYSVYRCKLCPLLTYNTAVMVNHYNQHKGMEYSCPVCLSVFSNKNTLNNHRRQAHKTTHICSLCARSFVSEKGLYFHKRLKHKDEVGTKSEYAVSCDKCEAVLTSPEVLRTHFRQVHESAQTIHKCFHCKEIFSTLDELKKHKIEQDHQRPPKPLTKPADDYTNKGDVTSDKEKPTCGECDRSFNSRKSYVRHVNTIHKVKTIHKCGFCQAKFTSASELDCHRTAYSHHRKVRYVKKQRSTRAAELRLKCNDPEKPFHKCLLCGEMISTVRTNTMYQHFKTSHPDTPYASVYAQPNNRHLCEQCGKTFKDLAFFLDHKNLHSGVKPYACSLCGGAYSTKRHLRLHAERHGPPRHRCNDCGKMFNSAANLFAHRRGHIGDRRFKCEICSKGFLHQAALNEHVRGVHNHIRRPRKTRDK